MTSRVAVAHNGIIENDQTLRRGLELEGYVFESETDSEIIPLLITRFLEVGIGHAEALRKMLSRLEC